jgi:hypothetical protein
MKTMVPRLERLFGRFQTRLAGIWLGEEGIETIEWVALGAVLAVAIGAIMALAPAQGKSIGQTIFDGIAKWAKSIGG